jgi:hypothetical protein
MATPLTARQIAVTRLAVCKIATQVVTGNLHAFDEPLVSVEVLGTTKELQELRINDKVNNTSFSHRPPLLITNALDLIRTPNPPVKQLQRPATNSP